MPRAWLQSFVCLLALASAAPSVVRAQFGEAVRPRLNENQSPPTEAFEPYPREEFFPSGAKTARQITPPATAAGAGDRKNDAAPKPASATNSLYTTFGSLAVIVVVILLLARTWKKHGPRIGGGIPAEALELLGKRPLDQRQSLHLVRLGSKILLLGSSPAGLRTLAEVSDPVDVDYLAGLCRRGDADGAALQTFRSLFTRSAPAGTDRNPRPRAGEFPLESRGTPTETQRRPQPQLEEAHD